MQLKPGTEVAVAPKRRKTNVDFSESSSISSSVAKALLRIQDPDSRFIHNLEAEGVKMGVVITSAVFIHPDTAKHHGFNLLQCMVIEPRLGPKDSKPYHQTLKQKTRSSTTKEINGGVLDKLDHRQAIVRLLFSESVAKGHIMLSQSLCLYLRASRRSCKLTLPRYIYTYFCFLSDISGLDFQLPSSLDIDCTCLLVNATVVTGPFSGQYNYFTHIIFCNMAV